jgi:hypothetical protein
MPAMYSGSSCTTRGCKRLPDDGAIDYHDRPNSPVTAEDEQTAYENAEHSTWPSWDFGW